jgi:hypothetical protein
VLRKEREVAPVEGCSEAYLEDLQLPSTGVSSGRVAGWMGADNLRVDYNNGGGLDQTRHRGQEHQQEGWKQTSFPSFRFTSLTKHYHIDFLILLAEDKEGYKFRRQS